jgi:CTP synthase (UTP-ammonia lyase)
MADAAHAEDDPDAPEALITPVSCPVVNRPEGAPALWGKLKVQVNPDSLAFLIYQRQHIEEQFTCNYELDSRFQVAMEVGGLHISGVGEHGEARIVELNGHPFFLASLFLPQLTSTDERPHPLVIAYLHAALRAKQGFPKDASLKTGGRRRP